MPHSPIPSRAGPAAVARPRPGRFAGDAKTAVPVEPPGGSGADTEQAALLRFLRTNDLLRHVDRRASLATSRRLDARGAAVAEPSRDAGGAELSRGAGGTDTSETSGGQTGRIAAPLIASAAASLAMADRDTHPTEVDLLCHLAERLSMLEECDEVAAVLFRTQ